jgi:hypothetical protein
MHARHFKLKSVHKGAKNKEQRTQIKYTSVNGVILLFGLQIITTVCSSSDLVGGVSSLCVQRCGRLLVYRLSGGEVQRSPLYIDFCPIPAAMDVSWMYQPGLISESAIEKRFEEVVRVDLRWSPAQLPDLVRTPGKAQNGLHTHL